jgi:PKD repeat protein
MRKLTWLLPVTMILLLALAVTTSVGAAANFEIENPTISPNPAAEGDTITISCVVSNTGDEEGTYTVDLTVTGTATGTEFTDTEDVTLEAGGSQTVNFQFQAGPPDNYVVELGDWSDYFTVAGQMSFWGIFPTWVWWAIGGIIVILVIFLIVLLATPSRKKQAGAARQGRQGPPYAQAGMPVPTPIPGPGQTSPQAGYPTAPMQPPQAFPVPGQFPTPGAFSAPDQFQTPGPMAAPYPQYARRPVFSVSNLTITPNQVRGGEPVNINAIVSNNSAEAGTYSIVVRINGIVENITDVTLSPGASQAINVAIIKDAGGEYYVEVDGLSGTFTVIPLAPANFSVSNLVIAPEHAKQGEKVAISALVTNNGEVIGTYSLVLKLNGEVESTEEISLNPGESQRVTFSIIKNTAGFYNVELDGLTGRFVAEMEWQG